MNLDRHEEYFRKTLQEHQVKVDTNDLWKQLRPQIDTKRPNRRLLVLWWVIGISFLLGTTAYSVYHYKTTPEEKPTRDVGPVAMVDQKSINTSETFSDQSISSHQATNDVALSTVTENDDSALLEKYQSLNQPPIAQKKLSIVSNKIAPKSDFEARINTSNIRDEITAHGESMKITQEEAAHIPMLPGTPMLNDIQNKVAVIQPIPFYTSDYIQNTDAVILPTTREVPMNTRSERFQLIAELGTGAFVSAEQSLDKSLTSSEEYPRTITLGADRINQAHLGIRYHVTPAIYVQTGLTHSKLIDKTEIARAVEVTTEQDGVQNTYYLNEADLPDPSTELNVVSTNFIEGQVEQFGRRQMLDIPVKIGFLSSLGRFDVGSYVGASYNILYSQRGKYVENTSYRLASADELNRYTNRINGGHFSYSAGIEAGYRLSPKLSVTLSPFAQYFNEISTLSGEKESILAYGANLGLKMVI